MDFWNRLRSELNYQDITHKELADKINIQKSTLEAKFLRENTPDAEFLYQCSKALNLSMDYLYSGSENNMELSPDKIELLKNYDLLSDDMKAMINIQIAALTTTVK